MLDFQQALEDEEVQGEIQAIGVMVHRGIVTDHRETTNDVGEDFLGLDHDVDGETPWSVQYPIVGVRIPSQGR
jgi:hypothetical protein